MLSAECQIKIPVSQKKSHTKIKSQRFWIPSVFVTKPYLLFVNRTDLLVDPIGYLKTDFNNSLCFTNFVFKTFQDLILKIKIFQMFIKQNLKIQ